MMIILIKDKETLKNGTNYSYFMFGYFRQTMMSNTNSIQDLLQQFRLNNMFNYLHFPYVPTIYCESNLSLGTSFYQYLPLQNYCTPPTISPQTADTNQRKVQNCPEIHPNLVNSMKRVKQAKNVSNLKVKFQISTQVCVESRNIIPNTVSMILSYIRRPNKSGKIVQRIIQQLQGEGKFSIKIFYSYQTFIKENSSNSKTKHTIGEICNRIEPGCRIFSVQDQKFYNRVCRILILHFLKDQYIIFLLNSQKICKTNKSDHLKVRRYLAKQLLDIKP